MDSTPAHDPPPEPWLDDDQQRAWRQLTELFLGLSRAIDTDLQRKSGLSFYEYCVLAALSEAPDRIMQMRDLAGQVNSSLSRLSHLISRTEKRGWVTKQPAENDRRASTVVLTGAGAKKIRDAAPGHAGLVKQLVVETLRPRQLQQLGEAAAAVAHAIRDTNRARDDARRDGPVLVREPYLGGTNSQTELVDASCFDR